MTSIWLIACLAAADLAPNAPPPGDAPRVNTRVFEIDYDTDEAALPLESVQLWYTVDQGRSWHHYGADADRQSPMVFHAPSEGLFGFFFVLTNQAGSSSQPPGTSTKPQLEAFVDFTPPIVQVQPLRMTEVLGERLLQIRWTAVDQNFGSRPIELRFQFEGETEWRRVTDDPVANTGQFDWRLPPQVEGRIAVQIVASDLGGQWSTSVTEPFAIAPATRAKEEVVPSSRSAPAVVPNLTPEARLRAAQLFAEGMHHRSQGDLPRAISRLREVVRLDPARADAFTEMGGMLSQRGDFERALAAFEVALQLEPNMRSALLGAARAQAQRNDLAGSSDRLRTLLRYYPNDAEAWLELGNMAVHRGDELLARDYYTRATQIDPTATQTIADAQRRLDILTKRPLVERAAQSGTARESAAGSH